jgi:lipopolysaccharide transport protein LptA
VGGDSFLARYSKEGELASVLAEKKCRFQTDDFNGLADKMHYDVAQARIDLSAKGSSVNSAKNTFSANRFLIHTRTRQLLTDQKVKATLNPGTKGVLLAARPLFVTASGLEMGDAGKRTRFKGDVSLFQDEIEMHAGELVFESGADRISCRGDAVLKFPESGETVELSGDAIGFDPAAAKIVIEGNARLRQGPNSLSARRIELAFDRSDKLENVDAFERVTFAKKDLTGKAQLLHWQYARKTIQFRNSAEITRKGAGTTRGQELDFDLEKNEITVSGAGDRSQTTIRPDLP